MASAGLVVSGAACLPHARTFRIIGFDVDHSRNGATGMKWDFYRLGDEFRLRAESYDGTAGTAR